MELITGFEPVTSSLPRKCSTDWAIWALPDPFMERAAGIEPASSAWKAEVLPLNYARASHSKITYAPFKWLRRHTLLHFKSGGGRWIRTTEAFASDLQSDPFGRSGIPPKFFLKLEIPSLSVSLFIHQHKTGRRFHIPSFACVILISWLSPAIKRLHI